jgi:hypothetical protein
MHEPSSPYRSVATHGPVFVTPSFVGGMLPTIRSRELLKGTFPQPNDCLERLNVLQGCRSSVLTHRGRSSGSKQYGNYGCMHAHLPFPAAPIHQLLDNVCENMHACSQTLPARDLLRHSLLPLHAIRCALLQVSSPHNPSTHAHRTSSETQTLHTARSAACILYYSVSHAQPMPSAHEHPS